MNKRAAREFETRLRQLDEDGQRLPLIVLRG
jgi:hypothetical protein